MQYFNPSTDQMIRIYAGDFADDFDLDAIVDDYVDAFNANLRAAGLMASLHADGSVTEWDWADMPGWNERTPLTREACDAAADAVDLTAIMQRHDTTAKVA